MTIIITLLFILIFGVFLLHLFDKKKTDNNFNKVKEFETETSKSFLTIIKTIQKVERDLSSEDGKIVNEHILLVELMKKLDERGIINMAELMDAYNKNQSTETEK